MINLCKYLVIDSSHNEKHPARLRLDYIVALVQVPPIKGVAQLHFKLFTYRYATRTLRALIMMNIFSVLKSYGYSNLSKNTKYNKNEIIFCIISLSFKWRRRRDSNSCGVWPPCRFSRPVPSATWVRLRWCSIGDLNTGPSDYKSLTLTGWANGAACHIIQVFLSAGRKCYSAFASRFRSVFGKKMKIPTKFDKNARNQVIGYNA